MSVGVFIRDAVPARQFRTGCFRLRVRLFLTAVLLLYSTAVSAETGITSAAISLEVMTGTGENLPFWFTANQLGKYSTSGNFQSLLEWSVTGAKAFYDDRVTLECGADVVFLASENETEPRIIEAYVALIEKLAVLKAGAFADEEVFGGLSSTNGEMLGSLNYRPYPKIRISTNGFIPFPFFKNWLQLSAEFDEGILCDNRVVEDAHLHHDSLMLRFLTGQATRLTIGINRFVFWGGHSDQHGDLPEGLDDYWRYLTASEGSSHFLETDRENAAGNQLGAYRIGFEKDFQNFGLELRIDHPFEDGSGSRFENYKDNLYILHVARNSNGSFLDEFVIEYLYSKHQSGTRHVLSDPDTRRGEDNYFNHGVYQSGFSYYGYSMGTPFFYPISKNADGTIVGFSNNRVKAWHTGLKGFISDQLEWKLLLSYSDNFGTYNDPYDPSKHQFFSFFEVMHKIDKIPLKLSAIIAVDSGDLVGDQFGFGIKIQRDLK